jgi:hypothetical protein
MTDHTVPLQVPPDETRASGRHPVNVGHLVMGVAFLGLFIAWALIVSDVVEDDDVRWLMPFPWVAAGIAGVLASVLPSRRNRFERRQTGWVASPEPTTTETTTSEETSEENR